VLQNVEMLLSAILALIFLIRETQKECDVCANSQRGGGETVERTAEQSRPILAAGK